MAGCNYPLDRDQVKTVFRFRIGTYVAVMLQEMGFPTVTEVDQQRLDVLLGEFLYNDPEGSWTVAAR
jgi:hypothetical protein